MKYSETHEWVDVQGNIAVVGVTEHAQKELGDIVYVELPNLNRVIKLGEEVAVLESTKAAADVYSPLSGNIIEVNEKLKTQPELINTSPESEGWIYKIQFTDVLEVESLLDFSSYQLLVK